MLTALFSHMSNLNYIHEYLLPAIHETKKFPSSKSGRQLFIFHIFNRIFCKQIKPKSYKIGFIAFSTLLFNSTNEIPRNLGQIIAALAVRNYRSTHYLTISGHKSLGYFLEQGNSDSVDVK